MGDEWAKKFERKLKQKELARQEAKKSFQIYSDASLKLFDFIERKVRGIEVLSVVRHMVGQSETTPNAVKTLKIKCQNKFVEFLPEGINLDESKGRIRLRHNARGLNQFVYLHLVVDPQLEEPYPDNLIWVLNENNATNFEELPPFTDKEIEKLIEIIFLSE